MLSMGTFYFPDFKCKFLFACGKDKTISINNLNVTHARFGIDSEHRVGGNTKLSLSRKYSSFATIN